MCRPYLKFAIKFVKFRRDTPTSVLFARFWYIISVSLKFYGNFEILSSAREIHLIYARIVLNILTDNWGIA